MTGRKKKIITISAGVAIVLLLFALTPFVLAQLEWQKAKAAVAGLPWEDGGRITMVREPCILDTPANAPVTCAASCPLVTTAVGTACAGYIELDVIGQHGTIFIAAPLSFVYSGGGTHPVAGMDFLAGGISNAFPSVIGIPRYARSDNKIKQFFDYIIAGFKE